MAAESLYDPIPKEAIRRAYAQLALDGDRVEDWAAREGFPTKNVYNVLSGKRMAIRGQALRIAIKLGLRPDPTIPAPQHGSLESPVPAGRTLAGGRPVASCDRSPVLQLGEAVR